LLSPRPPGSVLLELEGLEPPALKYLVPKESYFRFPSSWRATCYETLKLAK
jgi:hypothetical protein